MKKLKTIFFFLILLFLALPAFSQQTHKIDLDGAWKFRRAGMQEWLDAKVPGTVHTDLMANKVIEDPFFRDNEKNVQWIGDIGWEYKKTFYVSDTLFREKHVELVCQGLDTYANVYLNDSLIIVADNMFREWFSNIKYLLKVGQNELRIQFPSINSTNSDRYKELPFKFPGDERVVCRKAAYHFGWDWGPVLITSGIWKPVFIRTWNYTNLLGVQYIHGPLSDTAAEMTGVFNILSALADTARIKIYDGKILLADQQSGMKAGVNVIKVNFRIKNPRLWWPNGLGTPYLYELRHEVFFANRLETSGTTKTGLRTVELVQDKDSTGRSFYFKVNGHPVFMKGANYIPQDNFLPRVKDSSYRELIRSAKEANMNMLRVWGGGIYEKDIFYDLCDENGILVWQDFMFANAMYPGTPGFLKNVYSEAVQNVVRLRNHACLALWCGNNEIEEGWRNWGWQKQYGYTKEDSAKVSSFGRTIFADILPSSVFKFDSLRPYVVSSPTIGWGHPESLRIGDSHYWGVWWGKEPFAIFREKTGRFVSEYGFQGFPPMETLKRFTVPEDLKLNSPVMKAHQKHPEGFEIIDEYMMRDYKKPKDFASYDYVSMLLQAEGIQTAIEAHRRAKPLCMGSLYWQLNDCWPVVSWSSVDYYGNKKALYYKVKKDFSTILVSPVQEKGITNVYIISDSLNNMKTMLNIVISDFRGKKSLDTTYSVDVPANSAKIYASFPDLALSYDSTRTFLTVSVISSSKIIAQNTLFFCAPKNLSLEVPVITKTVKPVSGGYSITLTSKTLAKDVYITGPLKGKFSDNFFDILPGETKTVTYTTKSKDPALNDKLKIRTLRDTYLK